MKQFTEIQNALVEKLKAQGKQDFYLAHRRLDRNYPLDRIEIVLQPRHKSSGLSGDAWRAGYKARGFFKGQVVKDLGSFLDLKSVVMLLGARIFDDAPVDKDYLQREARCCDQPGCPAAAVVGVRLKRLFSAEGDLLADENDGFVYYRKFCADHQVRGDSHREDCDDNYEVFWRSE